MIFYRTYEIYSPSIPRRDRRWTMHLKVLVVLTMSAALATTVADISAAEPALPNIIVVLGDDMGYSDIGCYGGEIQTPQLDQLAAQGLRFTQFYNTGRCCPTRAALLTGLYSHQAGVGHMIEDKGSDGYRGELNRRCRTMAEVLQTAGYRNYAVGKWHVALNIRPDGPQHDWPLQRGFERFYGTITGAGSFYDPGTLTRDNQAISPRADPEYQPARYYYTDAISDHAVRYIVDHRQRHPDQPFFLYVAFTAAHWPMHAFEEDIARYRGRYDAGYDVIRRERWDRLKKLGLVDERWQMAPTVGRWDDVENKAWESRCMEVYAAMVDRMDRGIGRIVGALRDSGTLDQTLIMFLQDNGGCAENTGRQPNMARPEQPTLPRLADNFLRQEVIPKQTREGFPVLSGRQVLPGPPDTYIAYGEAWANVSNTPFRLYKHWQHEGGISTPLIAHWPRGIPAARRGQLEHQPGHLIDLMATCVDLAGARYPVEHQGQPVPPLEGVSLAPAFAGQPLARSSPLFWEHEGNRAVREGKWKLVANGPRGPWELYDIEADRTEQHDRAGELKDQAAALAEKWASWAQRVGVQPWPINTAAKNKADAGKKKAAQD